MISALRQVQLIVQMNTGSSALLSLGSIPKKLTVYFRVLPTMQRILQVDHECINEPLFILGLIFLFICLT